MKSDRSLRPSESTPIKTDAPVVPEDSSVFPVSFAQQRLWFLHRLEPDSPLYNVTLATRLRGPLDVAALQKALNAILQRHEPLRTTFTLVGSEPMQVIAASAQLKMPLCNLEPFPGDQWEKEAARLMREEAAKPFNLESDLMLRARLLRLQDEEHILCITMHHVASDGWSISVFFRELAELYAGFAQGLTPDLPPPAIQYADFSVWQRQWMQGEVLEKQLAYWKRQLTGAPPVLEMPLDHPRPAVQTYRGTTLPITLDRDVARKLKDLSQREGCTLFMVLLAAFKTLIARYTGQQDIVVGSPIAGRTRPEIEGLIGCFINTIVLRTDVSDDPTFRELLQRIRNTTLDAYAHQDLPFEKLVDELQTVRDRSYSPLFQMMFILQNTPPPAARFGGLEASVSEVTIDTTKFDFSLCLFENKDELSGYFEFATDLFERATVERIGESLKTLLAGIVAQPEEKLSRLPLLGENEKRCLLVEFNQNTLAYSPSESIHQLIERQALEHPNDIAAVWHKQRLTYRELNARANQLARHLRKLGAGPEVLVGICLERSLEMVIGLLGILKSGAAYVPLDPAYPKDRLAVILEDAEAPLLLTQQKLLGQLPEQQGQVLCLDKLDVSQESRDNISSGVQANNLAYVLFTSGSTGRPKGVAIEHRSVIAFAEWARTVYRRDELNGVLFSTSICFDLSVFELFVTLSLGGKIIGAENALQLPNLPAAQEVVLLNTVPSAGAELLRLNGIPSSIRLVNFCGEPLPQTTVDKLYEFPFIKKVYDLYGPTEDTVYSTVTLRVKGGRPNIGRPLANTQLYILDKLLQPVPIGVAGELYLGGAGLARGYWRRPDLTAERFVRHPFSDDPQARLYKTGDLVRYLPDGKVEYLGRLDHQVKIRGFRIELGEIETVLRTFPDLREVVVVAREDSPGDKRLVAYLSATNPHSIPSNEKLRSHITQKLPEYMVPSAFVFLPALPLTPNGKVDRKALPTPEPVKSEKVFVPPRDSLEQQLVKIWEEMFESRPIGMRDNFFQLGGHSLLAVRLFMQIEKITGKKLPLATLFEAPTLEQLAGILRQQGWEPPWLSLVPIKPNGSKPPFYCVHGIGGNILEYLDLAKYLDEDQPFYGLQAAGLSGKHRWHTTVEDMAAHYVKEIRDFQPHGPYYIGGSSFGGVVAFEMAQRLREQGEEVALLAFFDTFAPGYPIPLPTTSVWRHAMDQWSFRISLHWENFKAASGPERFHYVSTKIKKWIHGRIARLKVMQIRLKRRIDEIFWPKEITQTRQAGHFAYSAYKATPYPGSVVLFRATVQPAGFQPHPTLGWEDYIEGELEVHDTPGHHGSIVRDPRARVLAGQLMEALRKAQTRKNIPEASHLEEEPELTPLVAESSFAQV